VILSFSYNYILILFVGEMTFSIPGSCNFVTKESYSLLSTFTRKNRSLFRAQLRHKRHRKALSRVTPRQDNPFIEAVLLPRQTFRTVSLGDRIKPRLSHGGIITQA